MSLRPTPLLLLALLACARSPDPVLLSEPLPARPDTDEPVLRPAAYDDGVVRADLGPVRTSAVLPDGRAVLVNAEGALLLADGVEQRVLLRHAVGAPAVTRDGKVLVAVAEEPGAGDLWTVDVDGPAPQRLLAWPGSEGQPTVLDDGSILFVADRSGVASLYVLDADEKTPRQLTNHGARPGALGDSFVPPPVRVLRQEGTRVIYDAGDATWFVDVKTGAAGVMP